MYNKYSTFTSLALSLSLASASPVVNRQVSGPAVGGSQFNFTRDCSPVTLNEINDSRTSQANSTSVNAAGADKYGNTGLCAIYHSGFVAGYISGGQACPTVGTSGVTASAGNNGGGNGQSSSAGNTGNSASNSGNNGGVNTASTASNSGNSRVSGGGSTVVGGSTIVNGGTIVVNGGSNGGNNNINGGSAIKQCVLTDGSVLTVGE